MSDVKARRKLEAFEAGVAELAALGPDAIPTLLARLASETDPHARLLLLTGISRVAGEAGARGALDGLAALGDPDVEHLFLDRLVRGTDRHDVLVMEEILKRGENPEHRQTLIASAAARGNEILAGHLPGIALDDPDPVVRAEALASCRRLDVEVEPDLLEVLAFEDPDPTVRRESLRLYAAADPGEFVPLARALFASGDAGDGGVVNATLVELLMQSSESAAIALLKELVATPPSAEVGRRAKIAVRRAEMRQGQQEKGAAGSTTPSGN